MYPGHPQPFQPDSSNTEGEMAKLCFIIQMAAGQALLQITAASLVLRLPDVFQNYAPSQVPRLAEPMLAVTMHLKVVMMATATSIKIAVSQEDI